MSSLSLLTSIPTHVFSLVIVYAEVELFGPIDLSLFEDEGDGFTASFESPGEHHRVGGFVLEDGGFHHLGAPSAGEAYRRFSHLS
jgi:hypothetical protein